MEIKTPLLIRDHRQVEHFLGSVVKEEVVNISSSFSLQFLFFSYYLSNWESQIHFCVLNSLSGGGHVDWDRLQ